MADEQVLSATDLEGFAGDEPAEATNNESKQDASENENAEESGEENAAEGTNGENAQESAGSENAEENAATQEQSASSAENQDQSAENENKETTFDFSDLNKKYGVEIKDPKEWASFVDSKLEKAIRYEAQEAIQADKELKELSDIYRLSDEEKLTKAFTEKYKNEEYAKKKVQSLLDEDPVEAKALVSQINESLSNEYNQRAAIITSEYTKKAAEQFASSQQSKEAETEFNNKVTKELDVLNGVIGLEFDADKAEKEAMTASTKKEIEKGSFLKRYNSDPAFRARMEFIATNENKLAVQVKSRNVTKRQHAEELDDAPATGTPARARQVQSGKTGNYFDDF